MLTITLHRPMMLFLKPSQEAVTALYILRIDIASPIGTTFCGLPLEGYASPVGRGAWHQRGAERWLLRRSVASSALPRLVTSRGRQKCKLDLNAVLHGCGSTRARER